MEDYTQANENTLLSKIKNPKDLDKIENLDKLCSEIREKLIEEIGRAHV